MFQEDKADCRVEFVEHFPVNDLYSLERSPLFPVHPVGSHRVVDVSHRDDFGEHVGFFGLDAQRVARTVRSLMMLDNPAGNRRQNAIRIFDKLRCRPRSQPHFPINHAQPIGRGRPGQKIRLIDESPAMRQIIHTDKIVVLPTKGCPWPRLS